jgi:hypothetical protein
MLQKMEQIFFRKHNTIYYAQFTSCLHGKSFIATPKKTKFCRFSWKRVKFKLHVLHSLLFFFQKSFLGTQVPISLDIRQDFHKILS